MITYKSWLFILRSQHMQVVKYVTGQGPLILLLLQKNHLVSKRV